ncbi:MAG: HAMP domain-containing histidine kinase [Acidimicrobiales bacterium]|nr:HAMP domain-containing histidine kinase [Acidimicrobiales bacterium]
MPAWMGSIRVRLTLLYSVLLFGLAALVVAGVYVGLSRDLDEEPISETINVTRLMVDPRTGQVIREEQPIRAQISGLEHLVNERALEKLRNYSFASLGVLFVASLGVGWVVAGRVVRPIGHITDVATDIQATDLSRRIALHGPDDEVKKLADTFDEMLDRLDHAFEAQRRFIQDTSHELRNPLAVMRTNLDVALSDPDASADELRQAASVVARTVDRLTHLVDDLLQFARHGAPTFAHEPVDLADVVGEVAAEFVGAAAERDLEIDAAAPPGLWVVGDRVALRQALHNLVGNAVRLAPAGSVVRIAGGEDRGWAWMAVEDRGPGIPEGERDLVFQRFWRKSRTDAEGERGSGLGLTIVRQVAEGHNGEVRLASEEGEGTTFSVWLPAAPGGADTADADADTAARAGVGSGAPVAGTSQPA